MLGLGVRLLGVGVRVLFRMVCSSVALGVVEIEGWAELPWEYMGTPWIEVMMLAGVLFLVRSCWLGFVLRSGAKRVEREER